MVEQPPSSGFLTLLNESLSFAPERSDLWMTRFDILKSLGHRREFAQILGEAQKNAKIRRELNWTQLRSMWEEIAPGEPFPGDAEERLQRAAAAPAAEAGLPDLPAPAPTVRKAAPAPPSRTRRFNDIAVKIAGAELSVLAKAWGAIALKPGLLEDYARKTRALLVRPTPMQYSESLSRAAGSGMRIYLKREDRRGVPVEAEHATAQCYVGSQLGKSTVVTANDVDLHALEVATAAPFFGMKCTVVVRAGDLNSKPGLIADLKALGAEVEAMPQTGTLSTDPREGAVRIWQKSSGKSHLVLSLGMAPAPYTAMANAFQALLGKEAEAQYIAMASLLNRPRTLVAAVGSEADALGFVLPFLNRRDIRIAYAEPEPGGVPSWRPSARLRPYNGQIREHSWLRGVGRIQHVPVADADANTFREHLSRDGIKVGIEDARAAALAGLLSRGDPTPRDFLVLVG